VGRAGDLERLWRFRRFPLEFSLRIEPFEDESAVITEELVQPHRTQKENRIIVIALNPFAVTPWAVHH
jgi:hypothetical protein